MKIVFIGPFAMQPKRTMAARALPLGRALVARGHEVTLLLPPWDHSQDSGAEWTDAGVMVRNIRLPPNWPLVSHAAIAARLVHAALDASPDVIHCFKPKAYAGLSALVIWQLKRLAGLRARLVVDTDDWEGDGGWNEIGGYSRAQKRFFAWQEAWGLTHCDGLTVASRALQTIAWSRGVPPARVHYLPNGTPDAPAAAPAASPRLEPGDGPVALLYTRFFEFGVERALDVMRGVLRSVPEARWLVVGKGLFGEEERLLEGAREAGIAKRLTYAGWVPESKVSTYLSMARVAIYPFDDTLVNRCKCAAKLIDLLAAGVPVVADAVGQNNEYIVPGITGILTAPGDTAAMVAATSELLRDAQRARAIGEAAQDFVRREFSWSRRAYELERFYAEGLGGKR